MDGLIEVRFELTSDVILLEGPIEEGRVFDICLVFDGLQAEEGVVIVVI